METILPVLISEAKASIPIDIQRGKLCWLRRYGITIEKFKAGTAFLGFAVAFRVDQRPTLNDSIIDSALRQCA